MSVDLGIFEKIKALKERYAGEHPDALRQLEEWEKRVQKLSRDQEYFNQEATQELYKILKNRVKTHIIARLQKGRTPTDNLISDAQETECRWLLSMFNAGYEQEIATLEDLINNEI
jgi:hypothetical protein